MVAVKRRKPRREVSTPEVTAFLAAQCASRPEPKDPALVAASILLTRALETAGTCFADAGRDGVVLTVVVPHQSWMCLIRDVWRANARAGTRPVEGGRAREWDSGDWYCWSPEEPTKGWAVREQVEVFSRAVAQLKQCVGITPDLAWLPEDLVLSADYQLVFPRLSAADVGEIASEVCRQTPNTSMTDGEAALLTPRLLRLARRPAQTADEYIGKLKELLARDLAAQARPAPVSNPTTVRDQPSLERLHGMGEAVEWGLRLACDIGSFREGKILWADVDRGLLLSGPPGCGKTLFARALAATCKVPLVAGSYSNWLGTGTGHQGDLLRSMKETFAKARMSAPSILFIDEVDSFPNRAMLTHRWADWEIQVVNALLAEVDGVEGRDGIVLVAACNHPHKLDPALVRSGRLDRHIRIGLPNPAALARILREHLGTELPGVDLQPLALLAIGATGADIERIVRSARGRARHAGRDLVPDDLLAEISGANDMKKLRLAAVHEAGHAVVCCLMQIGLSAVSLRGSTNSGGVTMAATTPAFLSAADVQHRLVASLSGRAAEELVFGEPTSGAGGGADSDLAVATLLAANAASALGLDATMGLMWQGNLDHATVPKALRNNPTLATRVRQAVDDAYQAALGLLCENRPALEAVAAELEKRRALAGADIASIVACHRGQGTDLSKASL